jgi:hypothetical protein
MGFAIPKIQYKNLSLVGTLVLGSDTIINVDDTSSVIVGMFIRNAAIPSGALVGAKTATTVTLASSVLATASAVDATLELGYEILFDYPPKEPNGERLDAASVVSTSLAGERQVSTNNITALRKLVFSFLSPAVYALLDTFLKTHGLYGTVFRYYDDKTLTTFVEYELDDFKIVPKKIAPRGVDTYIWEVPLSIIRTI